MNTIHKETAEEYITNSIDFYKNYKTQDKQLQKLILICLKGTLKKVQRDLAEKNI